MSDNTIPSGPPEPTPTPEVPAVPQVPAAPDVPAAGYPGAPAYPAAPAQGYPAPPQGYPAPAQGYPAGVAAAPAAPDTRSKTLGLVALILAVVGTVMSLFGFFPIPVVGMIVTIIGGLLLLVALVLGIIALVSRTQGGNGLSIAAIVVAVLGGVVAIAALATSLFWTGLGAISESTNTPRPSGSVSEPGSGTYDEEAFLAEVRPQVLEIMQEINPDLTAEQLPEVYSDQMLVSVGLALGMTDGAVRDAAREQFIASTVESSDGAFTEELAGRFFDVVSAAADRYLVE